MIDDKGKREGLEPPWSEPIDRPGALSIRYRQVYSHALSFRFFDDSQDSDDDWMIEADVKWDGCINWTTNPYCLYHFCEPEDIQRLSATFVAAWALTEQLLPTADSEMFARKTSRLPSLPRE